MTSDEVVIGVDLGTTSTKAIAFDTGGRQLATASAGYPLAEPHPGWAEQDPAQILDAVLDTVRAVVSEVDGPVAALSFSSAMHTLIGLDAAGDPLTPSLSWADSRAAAQADRLRAAPGGLALHRRTGTPVHPMAPLPKLVWFREQRPELFARVACWAGIKDYVLSRLCGALVTDQSVASGTGLLDLGTLSWDQEALQLAGIGPERLPELVPTTTVLSGLSAEVADRLGLPAATPVVAGAGDGPLANLGLGAVHPGVAACSIGTSGALRVTVERPAVDPHGGVFCYALTEHRWVVGGAINNGGIVLDWAGRALAPDLGDQPAEALLELAGRVPPGSGGLVMLPYLLGERAPHWSGLPLGAYVGLTREHRREHLVRAAIEGVCLQLALVLDRCGPPATRCTRCARPAGSPAARSGGRSSPTRSAWTCGSRPGTRGRLRRGAARHVRARSGRLPRRRRRPGPDRGHGLAGPVRRGRVRGTAAGLRRPVRRPGADVPLAARAVRPAAGRLATASQAVRASRATRPRCPGRPAGTPRC